MQKKIERKLQNNIYSLLCDSLEVFVFVPYDSDFPVSFYTLWQARGNLTFLLQLSTAIKPLVWKQINILTQMFHWQKEFNIFSLFGVAFREWKNIDHMHVDAKPPIFSSKSHIFNLGFEACIEDRNPLIISSSI